MASIPWMAGARLIGHGDRATQVGTLRGCLRAWSKLPEWERQAVQISTDAPVMLDSWAVPKMHLTSGDLAELLHSLDR